MPKPDGLPSITGLVLAGGQGRRMGGLDKGLQQLQGRPLVAHVLVRLAPQVGPLLISANRHLADYAAFGVPVVRDAEADFKGPLAGLLAGLLAAQTDWLACAPCDAPRLPEDLVRRLADEVQGNVQLVLPRSADGRLQPLFALMQVSSLRDSLAAAVASGQRRVADWMLAQPHRVVEFEGDFSNLNSLDELRALDD